MAGTEVLSVPANRKSKIANQKSKSFQISPCETGGQEAGGAMGLAVTEGGRRRGGSPGRGCKTKTRDRSRSRTRPVLGQGPLGRDQQAGKPTRAALGRPRFVTVPALPSVFKPRDQISTEARLRAAGRNSFALASLDFREDRWPLCNRPINPVVDNAVAGMRRSIDNRAGVWPPITSTPACGLRGCGGGRGPFRHPG